MKILDYVEKDGMLVVTTDNPGRADFVYEAGRFNNLDALQREIERSILWEQNRELRKQNKLSTLKDSLDQEVAKNAELAVVNP